MRAVIALVFLFMSGAGAVAAWRADKGEDPINDMKWASVTASLDRAALAFKCWQDGKVRIWVSTVHPYDPAATYKWEWGTFRIDKQKPVRFALDPTNLGGLLAYTATTEDTFDVSGLLVDIKYAKQRVVAAIGGFAYEGSVRGSRGAIDAMISACNLIDIPPQEGDGEAR